MTILNIENQYKIMKHKHLTPIEQKHLRKARMKLRRYEKVVLRSGFIVTRAEVEFAKKEIANSPEGMYVSIEEAISVKRSFDEMKRGEYEVFSQYEDNYFIMVSKMNFNKK